MNLRSSCHGSCHLMHIIFFFLQVTHFDGRGPTETEISMEDGRHYRFITHSSNQYLLITCSVRGSGRGAMILTERKVSHQSLHFLFEAVVPAGRAHIQ